ncbi:MAG TPA: hypothetical protein PKJ88_10575, partial [Flexilinea sp.]|nr:hypothetical protein [Flexilinea sp.]
MGRTRRGMCPFSPRPLGVGQGEGRVRRGTSRTPSVFSLARWARVRVREEFGAGRTHLVPRRAS